MNVIPCSNNTLTWTIYGKRIGYPLTRSHRTKHLVFLQLNPFLNLVNQQRNPEYCSSIRVPFCGRRSIKFSNDVWWEQHKKIWAAAARRADYMTTCLIHVAAKIKKRRGKRENRKQQHISKEEKEGGERSNCSNNKQRASGKQRAPCTAQRSSSCPHHDRSRRRPCGCRRLSCWGSHWRCRGASRRSRRCGAWRRRTDPGVCRKGSSQERAALWWAGAWGAIWGSAWTSISPSHSLLRPAYSPSTGSFSRSRHDGRGAGIVFWSSTFSGVHTTPYPSPRRLLPHDLASGRSFVRSLLYTRN